jgi:hypothetical protein
MEGIFSLHPAYAYGSHVWKLFLKRKLKQKLFVSKKILNWVKVTWAADTCVCVCVYLRHDTSWRCRMWRHGQIHVKQVRVQSRATVKTVMNFRFAYRQGILVNSLTAINVSKRILHYVADYKFYVSCQTEHQSYIYLHYPTSCPLFKTRRFGDCILYPCSGGTHSVGPDRKSWSLSSDQLPLSTAPKWVGSIWRSR